jgi:hypothetical protein
MGDPIIITLNSNHLPLSPYSHQKELVVRHLVGGTTRSRHLRQAIPTNFILLLSIWATALNLGFLTTKRVKVAII